MIDKAIYGSILLVLIGAFVHPYVMMAGFVLALVVAIFGSKAARKQRDDHVSDLIAEGIIRAEKRRNKD